MRTPIVKIIGQTGMDLIPGWGPALVSVSFLDNDGGEANELTMVFSVSAPFPDSPAEGTKYRLLYGWEETAIRDGGMFTYQSDEIGGDANSGYTFSVTARSSDFIDADKAVDTEHFDDKTAGEIFQHLAQLSKKTAVVDPELAAIKLPYRLRFNQSSAGFGQDLADEIGGTQKFAGGKLLVPQRGSGKTASGRMMPPITIAFGSCIQVSLMTEGRSKFANVGTDFFDPLKGIREFLEAPSIGSASKFFSLHPARSQEEAKHAGKAQGAELARDSVSGSVTVEGDVNAMAGAPVRLSGFGRSRDAAFLVASSIQHDFSFDDGGGWLMTAELANRATKKSL